MAGAACDPLAANEALAHSCDELDPDDEDPQLRKVMLLQTNLQHTGTRRVAGRPAVGAELDAPAVAAGPSLVDESWATSRPPIGVEAAAQAAPATVATAGESRAVGHPAAGMVAAALAAAVGVAREAVGPFASRSLGARPVHFPRMSEGGTPAWAADGDFAGAVAGMPGVAIAHGARVSRDSDAERSQSGSVAWRSILIWIVLVAILAKALSMQLKEEDVVQYARAYVYHTVNTLVAGICFGVAVMIVFTGSIALVWVDALGERMGSSASALQAGDGVRVFWKGVVLMVLPGIGIAMAFAILLTLMVPSTWIAQFDLRLGRWLEGAAPFSEVWTRWQPPASSSGSDDSGGSKVAAAVWSVLTEARSWRSVLYCLLLKWPSALVSIVVVFTLNLLSVAFILAPLVYALSPGFWKRVEIYGEPLVYVDSLGGSYRAFSGGLCLLPCAVLITSALARMSAAGANLVLG